MAIPRYAREIVSNTEKRIAIPAAVFCGGDVYQQGKATRSNSQLFVK